jgi:hypothetical protein
MASVPTSANASATNLGASPASTGAIQPYEDRLSENRSWALSQGSEHFNERSDVFRAMRKIAARLDEIGIAYNVIGGMALFHYGHRRFTEDVDVLVTKDGLAIIHQKLSGLGYLEPHRGSKHLRDTEFGVRIEFLTAGEFPGDGKPKPVAFPDPSAHRLEAEGITYVALPKLVELKIASGQTNPGRLKDLADVIDLIRLGIAKPNLASQLDPYVQPKFLELCDAAKSYELDDKM